MGYCPKNHNITSAEEGRREAARPIFTVLSREKALKVSLRVKICFFDIMGRYWQKPACHDINSGSTQQVCTLNPCEVLICNCDSTVMGKVPVRKRLKHNKTGRKNPQRTINRSFKNCNKENSSNVRIVSVFVLLLFPLNYVQCSIS